MSESVLISGEDNVVIVGDKVPVNERAVLSNITWLNVVLFVGVMTLLVSLLSRVVGLTSGLEVIRITVAAGGVLTVAHIYVANLLNKSLQVVWREQSLESRMALFARITKTGGPFVRGLMARRVQHESHIVKMSLRDPTTYLALLSAATLVVAMVPFDQPAKTTVLYASVGLFLLFVNWMRGTAWGLALSDIAREKTDSHYFWFYESLGSPPDYKRDPNQIPSGPDLQLESLIAGFIGFWRTALVGVAILLIVLLVLWG